MTEQSNNPAGNECQPLPDCPELALFVAQLFQTLGGRLSIDDGNRFAWRPEPVFFRLRGENLPQLPGSKPWEQFQSADEWRGALKVADYWLMRLSEADKTFIFSLFAPISAHPGDNFDFRELLR